MLLQVLVFESYVAGAMENGALHGELCREQGNSGGALFCGNALIESCRGAMFAASDPTGVATTMMSPTDPANGALTEKVACPLAPVTTSVCEIVAP
jgi:hypothetical protein